MAPMFRLPALAAVVLLSAHGAATAQDVYRCKDKAGKTEFRDYPCDQSSPATQTSPPSTSPPIAIARSNQQGLDPRTGLPTNRADYERLLKACEGLLRRDAKARTQAQWASMRCDRVEEFEIWRSRNGDVQRPQQRAAVADDDCRKVGIQKPQPFLGTAEEVIQFTDGSIWRDISYKYLYLYAYSPTVVLCPAEGKMMLGEHTFTLTRLK